MTEIQMGDAVTFVSRTKRGEKTLTGKVMGFNRDRTVATIKNDQTDSDAVSVVAVAKLTKII